jgi:hypothetical protein
LAEGSSSSWKGDSCSVGNSGEGGLDESSDKELIIDQTVATAIAAAMRFKRSTILRGTAAYQSFQVAYMGSNWLIIADNTTDFLLIVYFYYIQIYLSTWHYLLR